MTEIVETMALQHAYPGFDTRSLRLGLPQELMRAPVKLFVAALKEESPIVKLAALRWFWEHPGFAERQLEAIAEVLTDSDEWVRREAARTIGRVSEASDAVAVRVSELLVDKDPEVRKAAAKTCGKLGSKAPEVLNNLQTAAQDSDTEVRWKAQKALRQLGHYVA